MYNFVPISQLRDLLSCQATPSILLYQVVISVLGTLICGSLNLFMLYFLHFSLSSFYVAQRVKWFPFFLVLAFFLCKLQSSLEVFTRFLENTTYCKPLFEQHQFYCAAKRVNICRDNLTHLNITAPSATVSQTVNPPKVTFHSWNVWLSMGILSL